MSENINPQSNFNTGVIDGTFTNYCSQVKLGSKPIAFMNMKTDGVNMAAICAKNEYQLNTYIQDVKDYPEWKVIYLYKHEYLINIIKNLPEYPQTPYEHWIIGKACGYSDDAIGEFISKII